MLVSCRFSSLAGTHDSHGHTAILNTIDSILFEIYAIIITWSRAFWVFRSLRKTFRGRTRGITYFLLRDGEMTYLNKTLSVLTHYSVVLLRTTRRVAVFRVSSCHAPTLDLKV